MSTTTSVNNSFKSFIAPSIRVILKSETGLPIEPNGNGYVEDGYVEDGYVSKPEE